MDLRYGWRDLEVGLAVPHKNYFDLDASYTIEDSWFDGLTIRAGVENLTDEPPPVLPNSAAANTDPSQFDVLGRRYYVTLALRFWRTTASTPDAAHQLESTGSSSHVGGPRSPWARTAM